MVREGAIRVKRLLPVLATGLLAASLTLTGCAQSSATPAAATSAPKAVAPAASAAPASATSAPAAAKVDFPAKGKSIQLIIPFSAGGSTDLGFRTLSSALEKELGTTVEVVNKPGAAQQAGLAEFVKAKPDGYTLGEMNLPGAVMVYMNPSRQATFSKKNFQPIAVQEVDPAAIAVAADGPYQTLQALVDAAKANPSKIKAATSGLLSDDHIEILDLQRATGAKFAIVHFESNTDREPALLGGKIDASFGNVSSFYPLVKAGKLKLLAVMDKQESAMAPGVKTAESQGFKVYGAAYRGIYAPAGTPKEIVDVLSNAVKKITADSDYLKKMEEMGHIVRYMGPDEVDKYWTDLEPSIKPLIEQAMAETK